MTRNERSSIARESEQLKKLLAGYVLSHGGRADSFYDWVLPTRVGNMYVSVHDDWLACRFEDVSRAREHFGWKSGLAWTGRLNVYSGKWNWGCGERDKADALFSRWSEATRLLLSEEAA